MSAKVSSLLGVSGRLGVALGAMMPYVRAGYAGGAFKTTDYWLSDGTTLVNEQWRNGYLLGGGIEFMVMPSVIAGVDYSWMNFGNAAWTGRVATQFSTYDETYSDKLTVSAITGRLSYRFGSP